MEPSGVHRGWGDNSLSKVFPYYKLEELVMIAFKNMLEDNDLKMDPLEVKGLINFAPTVSLPITSRINSTLYLRERDGEMGAK